MKKLIQQKLERFIRNRNDVFPNISNTQKEKWSKNINRQILALLDDNDIFYDNMPEDVEEQFTCE